MLRLPTTALWRKPSTVARASQRPMLCPRVVGLDDLDLDRRQRCSILLHEEVHNCSRSRFSMHFEHFRCWLPCPMGHSCSAGIWPSRPTSRPTTFQRFSGRWVAQDSLMPPGAAAADIGCNARRTKSGWRRLSGCSNGIVRADPVCSTHIESAQMPTRVRHIGHGKRWETP